MSQTGRIYCDRCHTETNVTTVSMFNYETICLPCKDRERRHPLYAEAQRAEAEAVRAGNFNFPGIGKPKDLT